MKKNIYFWAYLILLVFFLGCIFQFAPVENGWRKGFLCGFLISNFFGFLIFIWKMKFIKKKGTSFLIPVAGGFGINLFFLIGGTALTRYSFLLGHYIGLLLDIWLVLLAH